MPYLPIIGLEIHLELRTQSKMFCGCPAFHFGVKPNTQTCPVCLGLPGALPVPNQKAIDWTIMIGKALDCQIASDSKFDRKHYFYPDLPKGYQISQYDEPLCYQGSLQVNDETIRITRVHLEEDTGKLQHQLLHGRQVTLVDFNRSGVPLVEIVSEPDLHSAVAAKAYAQTIRNIINFLGVSDADMEKGSMRLEANISLQKEGQKKLPAYKVEVKNINSFNFLKKAIDFEITRQTEILDLGQTPKQETRGFNENTNQTVSQRSKEEAQDYRYFPEPDIPPLKFSSSAIAQIIKHMPMLPQAYSRLFIDTYHLLPASAQSLVTHRRLAEKALATLKLGQTKKIEPQALAHLLINKKSQTEHLEPEAIIKLYQKLHPAKADLKLDYEALITTVLKQNPDLVQKYQSGKSNVIGALIGAVMKFTHGQADPAVVKKILESQLKA